ncbi:DUF4411 family protein [Janthinobacterium agaricidamnosum]|uniref:DUF4411 family protein n=1 Tax=Janthinobacterium agaricidamnosum TaxID=55508 RepID=A0A3G2E4T7_9BURK|nr:DUF4411 family protein [Janthinobacterium agaricidamnosum]AYM74994.1 DUF4411 family protein [Janthinobacterium agaricidamnosum]
MLYLLDANVLITAQNQYYAADMVPEYWDWLIHMSMKGAVKMPLETFDEVAEGAKGRKDALSAWISQAHVENALVLDEEADPSIVQSVLAKAYAPDLNDTEVEQIGQDPFLIAYAYTDRPPRCVVSNETAKPKSTRANRKVPNACDDVGVQCCDTFSMLRRLGFTTGWRKAA